MSGLRYQWKAMLIIVIFSVIFGYLISTFGMLMPMACIGLSVLCFLLFKVVKDIRWGFYLLMAANFFNAGLSRYADWPFGLMIDFILLLIFITFFLMKFRKISWKPLANPVFIFVLVWMGVNFFEIANPEAHSFAAWFYAMRGVALYFILTLLVGYLCLDGKKDFSWFVNLWFVFSIMGTLWGLKQIYFGLDTAEKAWLNVPGNLSTHLLFGKLRVFSFYSDAGQFGASQAHTALVAGLLAIFEKSRTRKIFYIVTTLLCTYGMLISGTRGAFAIPVVGLLVYLLLSRNFKFIVIGTTLFVMLFGLLKFTFIGQGNYEIRRLRTSLNPNDPSLMVRIENQKKLAAYLHNHMLGGGVGSAGYWGQRFSPNTFLANLALDSWYVRIAAEYGYVGLIIYLCLLVFIVWYSFNAIRGEPDPVEKNRRMALFCGLAGILVASYTNQVFGQMPTGIIIYLSIVFLTQTKTQHVLHAKG